jgi:hypothetical protein
MELVLEDRYGCIHEALRIVKELPDPVGLLEDADQRETGQLGLALQGDRRNKLRSCYVRVTVV